MASPQLPKAVGVTPSPINVTSVLIVKEEVALELSLFDLADVAYVAKANEGLLLLTVEAECLAACRTFEVTPNGHH